MDKDQFWWNCPKCEEGKDGADQARISEAEMFTQTCQYCGQEFTVDFDVTITVNSVMTPGEWEKTRLTDGSTPNV